MNEALQSCFSSGTAGEVEKLLFPLATAPPGSGSASKRSERRNEGEAWTQRTDCLELKHTRRERRKGNKSEGRGGRSVLQSKGRDRGEEPCEVLVGGLAEEITALNGEKKTTFLDGGGKETLQQAHTYIYG